MDLRQALTSAVLQLLRPLVRVLLRHGMAYDEFAELARRSYVDVAEHDFGLRGRKQTTSRISVITGLNRKEVARLQALNAAGQPGEAVFVATLNRAARVVVGWQRDHVGQDGATHELDAAQFAALVRRHSGDMPARAVLDELRHTGTVTVGEDGAHRLQREGYVPQATDARKLTLLGQHAADLLGTIDHNLNQPAEAARLQQRVFADNIPSEQLAAVREAMRNAGLKVLADARTALTERDAGDATPLPGARRVTLGVYYSEAPAEATPTAVAPATQPTPTPAQNRPEGENT